MNIIVALLFLATLTSCTSYGPTLGPSYALLAAAALPAGAGVVRMSGPGLWATNANGFSGLMQQAQPVQGSLVLSASGIYFQQWLEPEDRYDLMAAIPYAEVAQVRKEAFGRNLRVVVKRKDLSVVSFSFVGEKHQLVDLEKTANAFELVSAAVKGGS